MDDGSRWPRGPGNRLIPDCTPRPAPKYSLSDARRFFAIGSCFARNIEEYLVRAGVDVVSRSLTFPANELLRGSRSNDLLVKYTPRSISQQFADVFGVGPERSDADYLVPAGRDDRVFDIDLPTIFPAVARARAAERRGEISRLYREVAGCDVVLATLGLVEEWVDQKTGLVLNGWPHPALVASHPDRFRPERIGYEASRAALTESIELLHAANPAQKLVLTVSPVPLARTFVDTDVIVANAYSKSVLRAVAGDLAARYDHVDYFPSYEMVTMSDRSAAFAADLRHVRDAKVGQVVDAFFKSYRLPFTTADYAQARAALDRKDFEAAFQILEFSGAEVFDDSQLRVYVTAAIRTNRIAAAIEAAQKAIASRGRLPGASWQLVYALVANKDFPQAREELEWLFAQPTHAFVAAMYLERVLRLLGRPGEAREFARKARNILHTEASPFAPPKWATDRLEQLFGDRARAPSPASPDM